MNYNFFNYYFLLKKMYMNNCIVIIIIPVWVTHKDVKILRLKLNVKKYLSV